MDSQVALSWIFNGFTNSNKNVFVNNRLKDINICKSEILKAYKMEPRFHYVPTVDNPSDLLTRGITVSDFMKRMDFWIHGPGFLINKDFEWPSGNLGCLSAANKTILVNANISEPVREVFPSSSFSSFDKLVRVATLVLKFISKLKKKQLNLYEMTNSAIIGLLKQEQMSQFKEEYSFLASCKTNNPPNRVRDLNLFLDENGVMRTSGRVDRSEGLDDNQCNRVLIPKGAFAELLVKDFHEKAKHMGTATTLNLVRKAGYWIPQCRAMVRRIVKSCFTCRKFNSFAYRYPKPAGYVAERVNFSRPYQYMGIDTTGCVYVNQGSQLVKCYILIFTCLSIRAIHLELIPSLSTKDILMSFTKFCNLYDHPEAIYCDNGSSLVKAIDIFFRRGIQVLS